MSTETNPVVGSKLADEVKRKVRERGLVIWIDAERQYTDFVKSIGGGAFGFTYPVVSFRGSFLETMLALEGYANQRHKDYVLIHLPGLNKETVKDTPLFELYKAGTVFEKNLHTLVKEAAVGLASQQDLDTFLREPELNLMRAESWFESLRGQPRDRLSLLLQSLTIDDVVLGLVSEEKRFTEHLPKGSEAIFAYLQKHLGLDSNWRQFILQDAQLNTSTLPLLTASWLMTVEFVTDLREPPVMPELLSLTKLGPFGKECRRLAALLRDKSSDSYEEFSLATQDRLAGERESHAAGVLGSIDTFQFEELSTRLATLEALKRQDWKAAKELANDRTPERSYWVKNYPKLQRTWEIMRQAANVGLLIGTTSKALNKSTSKDEAIEIYVDQLAEVDREHRIFEQRSIPSRMSDLDDREALLEVKKVLRVAYRVWCDSVNRAFFKLCREGGALPSRNLQQRAIYDDVVQPILNRGAKMAYVMVDALRFEMAQALAEDLKRDKYAVNLTARFAELPTITAVGMNALAPVSRNGRLKPVMKAGDIKGFFAGRISVCDPKDRVTAISEASLKSTAETFELADLQELSLKVLKQRIRDKPPLIVVKSRELDTAGEHRLLLGTLDHTIAQLKSAISLLSQAGIEQIVIVSDHGFLLQDDDSTEQVPFGSNMRAPSRRHAMRSEPSGMTDVLELRLSELQYDVDGDDVYLVLRPDTALWLTQTRIDSFVHGGNSLQERVVPVLVLERQQGRGKTTSTYEVVARAESASVDRQRLVVAVQLQSGANRSLSYMNPGTISLGIRVPGHSDVSINLLDAHPPAKLVDARIQVPPDGNEALVEFELIGQTADKVRVEIFHPDGIEQVTPKLLATYFEVTPDRTLARQRSEKPPPAGAAAEAPATPQPPSANWTDSIEDAGFRRVFEIIQERRSINESELRQVLGSASRVYAFSRAFDKLRPTLPFEVEVRSANFMKVYTKKD